MKLNLDDLNPGTFFPFDEFDDDSGGITIRLANGAKMDEINKKCSKKKTEYRRHVRHEYVIEDEKKRSDMLWDYVIMEWNGVTNEKTGEEIPCTTENKIMLMRGSVKFSNFVGSCIEKLTEEMEAFEEDLEKN